MSNDSNDDTFLNRWSRQKRDEKRGDKSKAAPEPKSADVDPDVDVSKLPKVEELTAESDITAFLQKGVPEALKKLALRRMWSLDPAIRDFVEVAENQWDFNAPGGIHGLYQDLAEGTDISVWMAQATQSVARVDAKPGSDASAEVASDAEMANSGPSIDEPIAAQHTPLSDDHGADEPHPPGPVAARASIAERGHAHQHTDGPLETKNEDAAPLMSAQVPSRRRHGGALPA